MARIATTPLRSHLLDESPAGELRLGAIDIGSNSLHMVIAHVDGDGSATVLWRMREMVGLGRTSFPSHRLTQEGMDRAIMALRRFQSMARRRDCEKIIAVATSAVREAENGGDFIERVRREVGLNVRIVSARDEARLIYLGVRHAMDLKGAPHAIVDIGGGSVEFIVGDDQGAMILESRKLGAARMTARFIHSDPPTDREVQTLVRHLDREITPVCDQLVQLNPVQVIGTSGTIENLVAMCGGKGEPPQLERSDLESMVHDLQKTKARGRVKIVGLDEKRQDQIFAGAILLLEVMKRLGVKRLALCHAALREGILLDYIARHLPDLEIRRNVRDPRRRSVLDLARRCEWHERHSAHVAWLTLRLLDKLQSLHKLDAHARELIEYGALLHDIGWHISSRAHHKHSMYLVLNGNLKGFTPAEVAVIASIARYHRKSLPTLSHAEYAAMKASDREIVRVGAALLRIADGLDRSHCHVVTDTEVTVGKRRVRMRLIGKGDMQLELWAARRKTDLFMEVFDRAVLFRVGDRKR